MTEDRPDRKTGPAAQVPVRALPDLRWVEMGPKVRVLQQAYAPAHGYGGKIQWRRVPTVGRKEAGYGE